MSENNDYIQLPPLKKDTPADVVAFMWEYMKVPEDSREKVKNLLKDANENGVKISHQAPTLYDVVPKEEILLFSFFHPDGKDGLWLLWKLLNSDFLSSHSIQEPWI